jgi:tetratricopeptide (TPR) repeat protein
MFSRTCWFILFPTTRAAICSAIIFAAVAHAEDNSFAARAERAFSAAQESVRKEPTNVVALVQFARASFDWAEFARKDDQRARIADAGITAARAAIQHQPTNAAAHYWLGMNLGQLARTKSLGALPLVREMEEVLSRARNLDEHVDSAGPDRSLGLLYRDAPGWPASIGSKKKARQHLERAVQLHPEFPDNQLALLESFEQWDERESFDRQLKATEEAFTAAKKKFTGPDWELSWADWNKRLAEIRRKSDAVGKRTTGKGGR